jgi:hypothetical protein
MKTCRICGSSKELTEFHKATGMRDGYRGECKECSRAIRRDYYLRNRKSSIERVKKWRQDNPERYRAYRRQYRELHGERKRRADRNGHLKRKYGLSIDDFEFLVHAQGGRCAICGKRDGTELHVDHDHKTGRVRGLLCGSCNRAMGLFHEDPNRFRSAELYLRRPQLMLGCGDKKTP